MRLPLIQLVQALCMPLQQLSIILFAFIAASSISFSLQQLSSEHCRELLLGVFWSALGAAAAEKVSGEESISYVPS